MGDTSSFSNWDWANQRIHPDLKAGQFISAETTLIASGQPSLSGDVATADKGANLEDPGDVYPLGLLEQFGLQQNKQVQQIFEIGSARSYFIPGRVVGSVSLGRTFFYGPSLLRALYSHQNPLGAVAVGAEVTTTAGTTTTSPNAALLTTAKQYKNIKRTPGNNNLWVDLMSDMFSRPTGLAVYFKDKMDATLGAFYLEECYVTGHQLSISSGSVLISEGTQLLYNVLTPIEITGT
jgi:hypothetical protein